MYEKTVTIFNYYEDKTGEAYWYPHVLPGVDLNHDRGAILKEYGPESTDNAELHIRVTMMNGQEYVSDNNHTMVPWLPPKKWKKQTDDILAESITFSPDCFFWEGEWTEGMVRDSDYRNGFYQHMNSNHDNVFKITSVGGPYTLIPHFEILGR